MISKSKTSLVLRVCQSDYTSHNGFQWPSLVGTEVISPDWKPTNKCGNGLHGWLYGHGDVYSNVSYPINENSKWLVLEVVTADIIDLNGKCKFPTAIVRFIGTKSEAADFFLANEPVSLNYPIIGASKRGNNNEVVYVGDLGTAIVGVKGIAVAGRNGIATSDYGGTSITGYGGISTSGDNSTAKSGEHGISKVGKYGVAITKYHGTAIAGDYGIAIAGYRGTASAGKFGEINIQCWNKDIQRLRSKIGYVGENGIKPDVLYRLNTDYEFEEGIDESWSYPMYFDSIC